MVIFRNIMLSAAMAFFASAVFAQAVKGNTLPDDNMSQLAMLSIEQLQHVRTM